MRTTGDLIKMSNLVNPKKTSWVIHAQSREERLQAIAKAAENFVEDCKEHEAILVPGESFFDLVRALAQPLPGGEMIDHFGTRS